MADVKTHLRELSVAVTVGLLAKGTTFDLEDLYDIQYFFRAAEQVISNDISSAKMDETGSFAPELQHIIANGYHLGAKIFTSEEFHIDQNSEIVWKGNDTQKEDPVDIAIGPYGFSLKENSFILENMGLYKLLNCFTGSKYKRRHIFKDYALQEYEAWFKAAWSEMVHAVKSTGGIWYRHDSQKGKTARIEVSQSTVMLECYKNGLLVKKSKLPEDCTLSCFEKKTNAKTREDVFAKYINENLTNNDAYNAAKKNCAIVATTNLAKELTDHLDYSAGLPRFLRIHKSTYYYAKTTPSEQTIYKVPSLAEFGSSIVIDSIISSVPDKQANILTTIRNKKTGQKLVLRNECRFSHGQFNGTPEAKMYYEHGGSLLTIYEAI